MSQNVDPSRAWRIVVAKVLLVVGFLLAALVVWELFIPQSDTAIYCGRGGTTVILIPGGKEYGVNPSAVDEIPSRSGVIIRIKGYLLNGEWLLKARVDSIQVLGDAPPGSCSTAGQ